jgi:lysophospholipase L1-like esterase
MWSLFSCVVACGASDGALPDTGDPAPPDTHGVPTTGGPSGGPGSTPPPPPPAPSGPLQATPSHVSMFGQIDVQLTGDLTKIGTVQSVTVNDIQALDVRATSTGLLAYLQGAPTPGPARIVVTGSTGAVTDNTALTYDPPLGGAPMKWAAFGASLTQGFQSGGLVAHGQIMSWAAQVARAVGAFLAPPLFKDGFLSPIQPSAFVNDCAASQSAPSIAAGAIQALADPSAFDFDFRRPRMDPTLKTRNFAIGGALVSDILNPASFPMSVVERIAEQPDGDPTDVLAGSSMSQVDRLVALDPDVALSGDLLANDSDSSVTQSDDLHPEQMTDSSTIASELKTLAAKLGALHGDFFIGNLLPLDGLPNVAVLRAQNVPKVETQQAFDAKLAQIRATIANYNSALAAAAAPYPNIHVVDLWTPTVAVLTNGFDAGGVHVTGHEFGGLLSLDFVHFSDTGYAFLANVFIDAINRAKGWKIPSVDVASVLAADALSPAHLKAAGVNCPPI